MVESSHTLVDLREYDDARELGFGVVGNGWVEDEDPYAMISFSSRRKDLSLLRTHVATRLGGHIFVCLCDEHFVRQLLVVVTVETIKLRELGVRGRWGWRGIAAQTNQATSSPCQTSGELYIVFLPISDAHKGILLS